MFSPITAVLILHLSPAIYARFGLAAVKVKTGIRQFYYRESHPTTLSHVLFSFYRDHVWYSFLLPFGPQRFIAALKFKGIFPCKYRRYISTNAFRRNITKFLNCWSAVIVCFLPRSTDSFNSFSDAELDRLTAITFRMVDSLRKVPPFSLKALCDPSVQARWLWCWFILKTPWIHKNRIIFFGVLLLPLEIVIKWRLGPKTSSCWLASG